MTNHPEARPFEVFARHGKERAIRHVGTVRAADIDDAEVFAYTIYDERKWVEMFVCPRDALVRVVEPA
jgi:1,2-phenylacetyl-CoA epoxidase PaaB subunit